jgi:hypothetical protein
MLRVGDGGFLLRCLKSLLSRKVQKEGCWEETSVPDCDHSCVLLFDAAGLRPKNYRTGPVVSYALVPTGSSLFWRQKVFCTFQGGGGEQAVVRNGSLCLGAKPSLQQL